MRNCGETGQHPPPTPKLHCMQLDGQAEEGASTEAHVACPVDKKKEKTQGAKDVNVSNFHSKDDPPPKKLTKFRNAFRIVCPPQESEKFESAGTVDFKKHIAQKVGTRSRVVSTQGSRQVCLSWCLKSWNL